MNKTQTNKFQNFITTHSTLVVIVLSLIMVLINPLLSYLAKKPLIVSATSYNHLLHINGKVPMSYLLLWVPQSMHFIIPGVLSLVTIVLLITLLRINKVSPMFRTVFPLLIITSPAFMFHSNVISHFMLFSSLVLGATILFGRKKNYAVFLSLPLWLLAASPSLFLGIIVLLLQLSYLMKEKTPQRLATTIISSLVLTIYYVTHKIAFVLGPFEVYDISSLLPDLGGIEGVSFFVLFLTLVGMFTTWKQPSFRFAYLLLPVPIITYILFPQTVFFLSMLLVFFASVGLINLFKRKWDLDLLKKCAFILIVLGIVFTSIAFAQKVTTFRPTSDEFSAFSWTKDKIPDSSIIFSTPETSYFAAQIADHNVFQFTHQAYANNQTNEILITAYLKDVNPLIEKHNISHIMVTKDMKEQIPKEYGFYTLLQDERFKLIHSSKSVEVYQVLAVTDK